MCYNIIMKIKKTNFGERLAEIRKSKNLTQRDFARVTGISNRMIAHYETKGSNIPLKKLTIMAKALNINIDELIGTKEIKLNEPAKKNTRLLNKLKEIETLPKAKQKAIFQTINAFLKTNEKD